MNANDVEPRALTVGSTIVIPTTEDNNSDDAAPDNEKYTIKSGDTFSEIALNYEGVSVNDIKEANPSIGSKITILK